VTSYPGTVSAIAATSGSKGERFGVVMPSGFNRPARRWGKVGTALTTVSCDSPAITAFNAGPPPL